jgi:hypothetical protein
MQVEGCVYWGLLEAFIGANVLQESRLARIFLLLAKPFKWQACMYVSQCIPSCALMCVRFCSIQYVSSVNSVADKA